MHLEFVEPSRRFADLILSGTDPLDVLLPKILTRIQQALLASQNGSWAIAYLSRSLCLLRR